MDAATQHVSTRALAPGDPDWAAAASLFDDYRAHYGEQPAPETVRTWLTVQATTGQLLVAGAWLDGRLVGIATYHHTPASLRLAHFWQLRDLYVHPDVRQRGLGRLLVEHVLRAAVDSGALRVSLQTEPDNAAALQLYRRLGFESVEGLAQLSRRPR